MKKNEVEEAQLYLAGKGINVSETAIINASFKIATRWGGYAVFVGEFEEKEK